MRILLIGDIVGRPGMRIVTQAVPLLRARESLEVVIANAENAADGSGLSPSQYQKLVAAGVDCITLGDHIYKKLDIVPTLTASERVVRPANLARDAAGRPFTCVTTNAGVSVCVFSLLGRIFMNLPADSPFAAADHVLAEVPGNVRVCVCDVHAEATSEKVALGHWMDGRVSFVFGTHTHIPTADAKVLPGGTAYVTDLGMCGPYDSVLGRRKDRVIKYMTTNMPVPFDVATGDVRLCGAIAEVDETTGRALSIERVEVQGESSDQAYDADDKAPPAPKDD